MYRCSAFRASKQAYTALQLLEYNCLRNLKIVFFQVMSVENTFIVFLVNFVLYFVFILTE